MRRIPKFASLKAEREFWDSHDAIEVLGEEGWKASARGATKVKSVYVAKVGSRGVIHVPREWLVSMGAKRDRLLLELLRGNRLLQLDFASCRSTSKGL